MMIEHTIYQSLQQEQQHVHQSVSLGTLHNFMPMKLDNYTIDII